VLEKHPGMRINGRRGQDASAADRDSDVFVYAGGQVVPMIFASGGHRPKFPRRHRLTSLTPKHSVIALRQEVLYVRKSWHAGADRYFCIALVFSVQASSRIGQISQ